MFDNKEEHHSSHRKILKFLVEVSQLTNCKTIIEAGISTARSAEVLLNTCPDAHYYGYDNWEGDNVDMEAAARTRLEAYNRTTITKIDTLELKEFPEADLIYLDADHSTKYVTNELNLAGKALRKNGIIIVHDLFFPETFKAVQAWLVDKSEWDFMHMKIGMEYGILWRKK